MGEKWLYSPDATQRGDDVAYEMRDYYEANRPLRWWEKRNPPGSWGGIADNLMLGLRNIVLDAERGYQRELAERVALAPSTEEKRG
jgi:hypothetical protein